MRHDLYTIGRRGVMVIRPDGRRQAAYFLQLAVRNALAQDAHALVDRAMKEAYRVWAKREERPELVVQIGLDSIPARGCPLFDWKPGTRLHCFASELAKPAGYLGERDIGGFRFDTGERMAAGSEMEHGLFGAWQEELRRGERSFGQERRAGRPVVNGRLAKVLALIRFIESKGVKASAADLQYLHCLKAKAAQLSCCG